MCQVFAILEGLHTPGCKFPADIVDSTLPGMLMCVFTPLGSHVGCQVAPFQEDRRVHQRDGKAVAEIDRGIEA
jgi:hypothetical protein